MDFNVLLLPKYVDVDAHPCTFSILVKNCLNGQLQVLVLPTVIFLTNAYAILWSELAAIGILLYL